MAKLDSQTPPRISHLDYNAIREKVVEILGTGAASKGYGQIINSVDTVPGWDITADQWTDLRNDIVNAKLHQDGSLPTIASVVRGQAITYGAGSPNTNYEALVNQLEANRFNLGNNQSIVSSKANQTVSGSWSSLAECTVTVTFSNANNARYFFNSGGKIRFESARSGGTEGKQNTAWTLLLSAAGTVEFSANNTGVNFYNLTSQYQTILNQSASVPYSVAYYANFYKIQAKSNVSSNVNGTATILTFKITWTDGYVDTQPDFPPPDRVNGTLSLDVSEIKAYGVMQPSGTFNISSPSYSITAITLDA